MSEGRAEPAVAVVAIDARGHVWLEERHGLLGIPVCAPSERLNAFLRGNEKDVTLAEIGAWGTLPDAPERGSMRMLLARIEGRRDDFCPPEQVLVAWAKLEVLLHPLAHHVLRCAELGMARFEHRVSSIPETTGEPPLVNEVLSGIRQIPLRSPTLPPARHTNAYVVGQDRLIVVDPAPYEREEREKLVDVLETLGRRAEILGIVLTHHHGDHMGAAMWLKQELGVPIWAHAATRARLEGSVDIDRALDDGETIELGTDTAGRDFTLEVLLTPGHAPGHIVLVDCRPGASAMIVGDMVAAVGTILIDPPDGDMTVYLQQLARLAAMNPRILFPAHGPPIIGGREKLEAYIEHRLLREAKVLGALQQRGPCTPDALLDLAYDDTPPVLYPLAFRSCLAHLEKLVHEGRASRHGFHFGPA